MESFNPTWLLVFFGVLFVTGGVACLTGWWKSWYWTSQRSAFGYLPAGLLFLAAAFEEHLLQSTGLPIWELRGVYVVLMGLAAWGFLQPPVWIKPAWIRTIESYPPGVYLAMRKQARKSREWKQFVQNPEELERWIAALLRSAKEKKKGK